MKRVCLSLALGLGLLSLGGGCHRREARVTLGPLLQVALPLRAPAPAAQEPTVGPAGGSCLPELQ